jgi:hypothetical protein
MLLVGVLLDCYSDDLFQILLKLSTMCLLIFRTSAVEQVLEAPAALHWAAVKQSCGETDPSLHQRNSGSQMPLQARTLTDRSKHIDVKYHFL